MRGDWLRVLNDLTARPKRREPFRSQSVELGRLRLAGIDNIGESLAIVEGEAFNAVLIARDKAVGPFSVYHAAGVGNTSVREIAEIVVAAAARADTRIIFTGGDRGWPGDVPRFRYDTSRLQALGWRPRRRSTDAVHHAVERILANGF